MPATPIQALDERIMPFSADAIWSVLADVTGSPHWWPTSVQVKVIHSTPVLVGSEMDICPRGGRPFRCRVEAVEAPRRMVMRYPGEFITGTGEWRLDPIGSHSTHVIYMIDVSAQGWLATLLGRVLPLSKIHSRSMQDILTALERETARRSGTSA